MTRADQLAMTASPSPSPSAGGQSPSGLGDAIARLGSRYASLAVLVLMIAISAQQTDGFFRWTNLATLLSQHAAIGIVAVGMTFVLICGHIDVSVGAAYAAGNVLFAEVSQHHSIAVAITAALVVGAGFGLVNGLLVSGLGLNSFVTTLGTGSLFAGGVLLYAGNDAISSANPGLAGIGTSTIATVPVCALLLGALLVGGGVVLGFTVYGRLLYMSGENAEAGRLAGVRVGAISAVTYVIAGVCAALAGVIIASQTGVGQGQIGGSIPLEAIAVVVIGGTSLFGGDGAMWRTAVGLGVYATLDNLFTVNAVSTANQDLIRNGVLVLALAADALLRRRQARR